jgi:hypothetical protein
LRDCGREDRRLLDYPRILEGQGIKMANSQDITANKKTYGGFLTLLKWSIPITALLVLIIIALIA